MKANAGTQFDPVVVAALCDVHASLSIQRKYGLGIPEVGSVAAGRLCRPSGHSHG